MSMQVNGKVVGSPGAGGSVDWLLVRLVPLRSDPTTQPLATAVTDALGRFRMAVDPTVSFPATSFSVLRDGQALPVRAGAPGRGRSGVEVTLTLLPPPDGRLAVGSLADLQTREAEAVSRLNRLPQGGLAFLTDPLRALAAAGVDLSPQAAADFRTTIPHAPTSTATAFDAVLRSSAAQSVRVRLTGIFERAGGKP